MLFKSQKLSDVCKKNEEIALLKLQMDVLKKELEKEREERIRDKERSYIKDRLEVNKYDLAEYIERPEGEFVKLYDIRINSDDWTYYRRPLAELNSSFCIKLRDFLNKNFPKLEVTDGADS